MMFGYFYFSFWLPDDCFFFDDDEQFYYAYGQLSVVKNPGLQV